LRIFEQESVDLILCVGNIAGYGTELEQSIKLLIESGRITLLGNHDAWYINHNFRGLKKWVETFFYNLPVTWESTIEGKRFFAVHASPPVSTEVIGDKNSLSNRKVATDNNNCPTLPSHKTQLGMT